jgi:hypothetical protein
MMFILDMLAIVAVVTFGLFLSRSGPQTRGRLLAALLATGVALAWGVSWTWLPVLANWRLGLATTGEASALPTLLMVAGTSLVLSLLAVTPAGQRLVFAGSDRRAVLALGSWRTVFGLGLLMVGLGGGLPPAFFWSAGIGDIAVGVLSTAMLARGDHVPDRQWYVWNALGLADLLHVLVLAATYVRPFFEANPTLPPLNLVPLVIVPIFIAMHVGALRQGWVAAREARETSSPGFASAFPGQTLTVKRP